MRTLLYVPIIHTGPDLGSMADAIGRETASLLGEERWEQHRETVSKFWSSVEDYLLSSNASNMKIYQDGLAAEGEVGVRVVQEAAKRGSKNHQILLDLVGRGAEIRKTEDAALLIQEYERLSKLVSGDPTAKPRSYHTEDRLMEQRDRFIAKTINETLRDGETAILFVGAYHNVSPNLASDIVVRQVKEIGKVKAYFRELFYGRDERKLQRLAHYLVSPVQDTQP